MDHRNVDMRGVVFYTRADPPLRPVDETGSLTFTAIFAQTRPSNDSSLPEMSQSCDGAGTTVICTMTPATMEYSVVLRDNVISVDTSAVKVAQTNGNHKTDSTHVTDFADALYGLSFAANSIVQSNMSMLSISDGWQYTITGSSISYLHTSIKQDNNSVSCEITSTDPTNDILTTFNEIMFRISLAAMDTSWNRSIAKNYTMRAHEYVIVYESRYVYLAAATFISLLACCSVLPTFNGFRKLNRPFSLSPIEIAKAFDAPLLRCSEMGTSDLPVDKLLKHVGTTEVQYAAVTDGDGEDIKLRERKFAIPGVA
ncbi:hypothetical protein KCV07_g3398, partial [Aureobasidium melanogenum]